MRACAHHSAEQRVAGLLTDDSVLTGLLESNGGCRRFDTSKYEHPVDLINRGKSSAAGRALNASKLVSDQLITS